MRAITLDVRLELRNDCEPDSIALAAFAEAPLRVERLVLAADNLTTAAALAPGTGGAGLVHVQLGAPAAEPGSHDSESPQELQRPVTPESQRSPSSASLIGEVAKPQNIVVVPTVKTKVRTCKCGSTTHLRTSHALCPLTHCRCRRQRAHPP